MPANQNPKSPWEQTKLWQRLTALAEECGAAKKVQAKLTLLLPDIDAVLHSGGTQPKDFTLHDDTHALRVALRMDEILTDASRDSLSSYEIALLLLSAWLHDIGMVPEIARFIAHRDYLLTGSRSGLTEEDHAAFQKYLDDRSDSPRVPFITGTPAAAEFDHADLILAYYVRERHNDWSADWIRQHLPDEPLAGYADFRADLIRLCDSHHRGQDVLAGRDFDSRLHGQPPQPVALRYLACVLRVADILENSPDRVPDVVFRHRDVGGRSILHWEVPHRCSQVIHGGKVTFHGSPKTAAAHKAMLDLAGAIDRELTLCADLRDAQPFGRVPGHAERPLAWPLERKTAQHIEPAPGSDYEYIDGTFRPDTQALLRLVAGESLYGTPLAAVRELLQNAFDAVREKIALRRLQLPDSENPADPAWEEKLGNEERVTLRLERRADGHLYLICTDTGTGMTRDIIRDRLLVSGRPPGSRHKELERRCQAKGFTMGRTARFGIGCLSYFMLADEVTIETGRWQQCGDAAENCTWQFRTTGTGEFGELKKLPWKAGDAAGTVVVWRIQNSHHADADKLVQKLVRYLRDVIVRVPCRFQTILPEPTQEVLIDSPAGQLNPVTSGSFELIRSRGIPNLYPASFYRDNWEVLRTTWCAFSGKTESFAVGFKQKSFCIEGLGNGDVCIAWFSLNGCVALSFPFPVPAIPHGPDAVDWENQNLFGIESSVSLDGMRCDLQSEMRWINQSNQDTVMRQSFLGHGGPWFRSLHFDLRLVRSVNVQVVASRDTVIIDQETAGKLSAASDLAFTALAGELVREFPCTLLAAQLQSILEQRSVQPADRR